MHMTIRHDNQGSNEDSVGLLARLLPQGRDAVSIAVYLIILIVLILLVTNRVDGLPVWRFNTAILCVVGQLPADTQLPTVAPKFTE
jgi:hypothetical protein